MFTFFLLVFPQRISPIRLARQIGFNYLDIEQPTSV